MVPVSTKVDNYLSGLERKTYKIKFDAQPLGHLSGKASEFEKSLEAANARVVAFGASASLIAGVGTAMKAMVREAVLVDRELTDINAILQASTGNLQKFGDSLFDIAKNTGSSFSQVADAAKEFARQGLSMEETLSRTNGALVLTRLSGLEVQDSVKALTGTLNTFTKEALGVWEVVNRLANVDAAFAVSSADLATAISRVGNVAEDSKISLNELLAAVTAVQQRTARGGATIGEAFKTIFTRLERSDTIEKLGQLGIATKNVEGQLLPAMQVMETLADRFYTLSDSQQSYIAEAVGGVRQLNILKALLKDLGSEYSIYKSSLDVANNTTNEATTRNNLLNQSLAALKNRASVDFSKFSAATQTAFAPALEKIFGGFSEVVAGTNLESSGKSMGDAILKGLGSVISGPVLQAVTVLGVKFLAQFSGFAAKSLQQVLNIGSVSRNELALQKDINAVLAQTPHLYDQILTKAKSTVDVVRILSEHTKELQLAGARQTNIVGGSAALLNSLGAKGSSEGNGNFKLKASGFVPNFVDPIAAMGEVASAKRAGYNISPSEVRSMRARIDGRSTEVVYNTRETVIPNFAGTGEPAIVPPNASISDLISRKYAAKGVMPGGQELIGKGSYRRVYTHEKGIESIPRSAEEVYPSVSKFMTLDDVRELMARERRTRPALQKSIGDLGLGPKVFDIREDGSYVAERVLMPKLSEALAAGTMTSKEASSILEKAKKSLKAKGLGNLNDVTFNNVAGNVNTGKFSVLDFGGGFVPNFANYFSAPTKRSEQLPADFLEKLRFQGHMPRVRIPAKDLAVFTPETFNFGIGDGYASPLEAGTQLYGYGKEDIAEKLRVPTVNGVAYDAGISARYGNLMKGLAGRGEAGAVLQSIFEDQAKKGNDRIMHGLAVDAGAVFSLKTDAGKSRSYRDNGPDSSGKTFESDFFRQYLSGSPLPSSNQPVDVSAANIEKLRSGDFKASLPSWITRGELKISAFEYSQRRGKSTGASPSISRIVANELVSRLDEALPAIISDPSELRRALNEKTRKGETFGSVLSRTAKLNPAIYKGRGFVPNFSSSQISAREAIASGLTSQIPGLGEAISREVSGTGVSLDDTRVNLGGHLPVSVTNVRDEGPLALPEIGAARVSRRGGNPRLAGSGKEYLSRGYVPNFATEDDEGLLMPSSSNLPDRIVVVEVKNANELGQKIGNAVADADKKASTSAGTDTKNTPTAPKVVTPPVSSSESFLDGGDIAPSKDKEEAIRKDKEDTRRNQLALEREGEAYQKRRESKAKWEQRAIYGSLGVSFLGGAISSQFGGDTISDRKTGRRVDAAGEAISTGLGAFSATGNVYVGAAAAVGSLLFNLGKLGTTFEDLAKESEKLTAKHAEVTQSLSGFSVAVSQTDDLIKGGASKSAIFRAQQAEQEAFNRTPKELQSKLLAANRDQETLAKIQIDIAKEQEKEAAFANLSTVSKGYQEKAYKNRGFFERVGSGLGLPSLANFVAGATGLKKTDELSSSNYDKDAYKEISALIQKTGILDNLDNSQLSELRDKLKAAQYTSANDSASLTPNQNTQARIAAVVKQQTGASLPEEFSETNGTIAIKAFLSAITGQENLKRFTDAQKSAQAFYISIRSLSTAFQESQRATSAYDSFVTQKSSSAAGLAFGGLRGIASLNEPFTSSDSKIQESYRISKAEIETSRSLELEKARNEARVNLSQAVSPQVIEEAVSGKGGIAFKANLREVLAQAQTGDPSVIVARLLSSLENAKNGKAEGVSVSDSAGAELISTLKTLLFNQNSTKASINASFNDKSNDAFQQAGLARTGAALDFIGNQFRGSKAFSSDGQDISTSSKGFAAILEGITLTNDKSAQRRFRQSYNNPVGPFGPARANLVYDAEQKKLPIYENIAAGIKDDAASGLGPTQELVDFLNRQGRSAEAEKAAKGLARNRARLEGAYSAQGKSFLQKNGLADFAQFKDAIKGDVFEGSSGGRVDISRTLNDVEAAVKSTDFGKAQSLLSGLRTSASPIAAKKIDEFSQRIGGLKSQSELLGVSANLQAAKDLKGGAGPLTNDKYWEGVIKLYGALVSRLTYSENREAVDTVMGSSLGALKNITSLGANPAAIFTSGAFSTTGAKLNSEVEATRLSLSAAMDKATPKFVDPRLPQYSEIYAGPQRRVQDAITALPAGTGVDKSMVAIMSDGYGADRESTDRRVYEDFARILRENNKVGSLLGSTPTNDIVGSVMNAVNDALRRDVGNRYESGNLGKDIKVNTDGTITLNASVNIKADESDVAQRVKSEFDKVFENLQYQIQQIINQTGAVIPPRSFSQPVQ
jgi:hypothetical protein